MPSLSFTTHCSGERNYRPRPLSHADGLVSFGSVEAPASVFVRESVLRDIYKATERVAPQEALGFLAGRTFRSSEGDWALVEAAFVCSQAKRTRVRVESTDGDQAGFEDWLASEALAFDKLGWWHSHYELGVSHYSGVDLDNQAIWCSEPNQLGLLVVVDDGKVHVRAYCGPDSDELAPFLEYVPQSEKCGLVPANDQLLPDSVQPKWQDGVHRVSMIVAERGKRVARAGARATVAFSRRLGRSLIAAWIAGLEAFLQVEPTDTAGSTNDEIVIEGGGSNGRV